MTLARGAREVRVDGARSSSPSASSTCSSTCCATPARSSRRDQLLETVWGFRSPGETRTVEVHVAQLRKKLGQPELIRTVRGLGYKARRA